MSQQFISIDIKKRCCDMKNSGVSCRDIYDTFFKQQFSKPQSYNSFVGSLRRWVTKVYADETTLEKGTYEGFTVHDATVQVSGTGEIVQAWIKQKVNEIDVSEFLDAIGERIEPYINLSESNDDSEDMLEIPLFDMHWGIAFMDYYKKVLNECFSIIDKHRWKKIVIPFGQDFFHNDSIINGITTKGTIIEKVDMVKAVKEGLTFMYSLIEYAMTNSDEVKVVYSAGNHDKSISWMFMQVLLERYGTSIVDDSLEFRKVLTYGKNSVMVVHGNSKRATPQNLAHIFPIAFPEEFSRSSTREVHAGHLHSETDVDVFGVMVRRLSSGNKTDDWSDQEDFIGSHKRFMLFDWGLDKLKAIYYI